MNKDITPEGKHHFYDLAKSFDTGMLVSVAKDCKLHARPMRVLKAAEGEGFWFVTTIDSPKVEELYANSNVNISFQSGYKYLSVMGKANIGRDRSKLEELWTDSLLPWFPKGKESADIAMIQVIPELGDYWDFSGITQRLQYAFEASKAYLTGSKINEDKIGDSGRIDFRGDINIQS